MLGKTHMVGGVCAGVLTTTVLLQTTNFSQHALLAAPLLIVSAGVGGLLPDIDHPNSKIGRKLKPISFILNKTIGHRGATHTLLALVIVSLLLFMANLSLPIAYQPLGWMIGLGVSIGYLSHLILDALTPAGVPLLAPFTSRKIRLAKLTTGKYDTLVTIAMIASTAFVVYATSPFTLV